MDFRGSLCNTVHKSSSHITLLITLFQTFPSVALEFKNHIVDVCDKSSMIRAFYSGCERTSPSMASSSPPGDDVDEALLTLI